MNPCTTRPSSRYIGLGSSPTSESYVENKLLLPAIFNDGLAAYAHIPHTPDCCVQYMYGDRGNDRVGPMEVSEAENLHVRAG